jgi:hypothetical protein
MILSRPSFDRRLIAAVTALVVLAGGRPALAAYAVTGDVLGQVCANANDKATCGAPFFIDEIMVDGKQVDLTSVPAVTDVDGANCRIRINSRGSAPVPELQPLMTAKFMVDTHDKVDAVAVDYLVFRCQQQ